MPTKSGVNVGVVFDRTDFSRIERQAHRYHGKIQGAVQDYVRAATMKKLLADEQQESIEAADAEMRKIPQLEKPVSQ